VTAHLETKRRYEGIPEAVHGDPMLLPFRGAFDESLIEKINSLITIPISHR
jgi:hypothetical protein